MPKELKIWNGRACGVEIGGRKIAHFYACAYSIADLRRALDTAGYRNVSYSEIKQFWSPGCWGILMKDVTPERGVWVSYPETKWTATPTRIL